MTTGNTGDAVGTKGNASTVGNNSTVDWRAIDDLRPLASATTRPAFEASPADIEAYQTNGVVHLPAAFTDWVEPLRAGLERNLAHPDSFAFPCDSTLAGEPGRFFDSYCNWQLIPEYLTFVLTSAAASMAAAFMESDAAQLFHEHAFSKEPGTAKATPWHHDLPYYCVDGRQTASIYIALDDISAETAVQFLRGSHRSGELYKPRTFSDGTEYETGDESMLSSPAETPVADGIFTTALAAGDALVFDFRTLHGSTDAPLTARRRAFSTRWLGDDTHFVNRPGETSPPLEGLGLQPGDRMRDDWFPTLWPNVR